MQSLLQFLNTPDWDRQITWRRAIWKNMSRLGLTGLHTLPVNRRWLDIQHHQMPLRGLDQALSGFRIVQISDLHYSPMVLRRYLIQCLTWVNELKPDLVVVTGDLITGGYRFARGVATVLSHLHASRGTVCILGNHDYSLFGRSQPQEGLRRAAYLQNRLEQRGITVLRNQSIRIAPSGADLSQQNNVSPGSLVLVGLDDEWTDNINASRAFEGVREDDAIICLNHNPANVRQLVDYPWQWMLSGHTHGRQTGAGRISRAVFPGFRHYIQGYYSVGGKHLYVNRGLSYGQRTHDWCRPEITLFTLTCAPASAT